MTVETWHEQLKRLVAARDYPAALKLLRTPVPSLPTRAPDTEQLRKDASDQMQYTTTGDLSARLMCRVDLSQLTTVLAWVAQFPTQADPETLSTSPPVWQPIETAPKDGRDIILYVQQPKGPPEQHIAAWAKRQKSWFVCGDYPVEWDGEKATHWMPLPAPPATGGE